MEFYTTLLTIDSGNTDDVRRYISAVKKRGFKVLAPNINKSGVDFVIDGDSIIFGVSGIKGVGKSVSNKILKRRPKKAAYKGLGHFITRNIDCLNKKILEQYAKAGMFSAFGVNKASALASVRDVLDFMDKQKAVSEYETIFDTIKEISLSDYVDNCKIKKIDKEDDLSYEIETLGFYITKHPLDGCILNSKKKNLYSIKDAGRLFNMNSFVIVGAICSIDVRKTKSKTNMATFDITTADESLRCTVFPKSYSENMDMIEEGKVVVIKGIVKEEEDSKTFIINQIEDDYESYLLVKEKKNSDYIKWIDIRWFDDNDEIIPSEFGIVVSDKLSYILEK